MGVAVILEAAAARLVGELVARVRVRLVVVEAVRSLGCARCRVEVEGVRACCAAHAAEIVLRVVELGGVRDAG